MQLKLLQKSNSKNSRSTGDLIGNKSADKTSHQINSKTDAQTGERLIETQKIYIALELLIN